MEGRGMMEEGWSGRGEGGEGNDVGEKEGKGMM